MSTQAPPSIEHAIDALLPKLVELRHDLHQHPELSNEEHRTSECLQRELAKIPGLEVKAGFAGGTGLLAHLPATTTDNADQLAVALRADIDALPITEATGKPWASKTPGVMHACGHDGHTTILLGAARLLATLEHRPNPITFIFQPAEEHGGGANRMCNEGVLDGATGGGLGPRVARVFGLHGWPQLQLGLVGTRTGPLLAATDDFIVNIRGTGGHAAMPHLLHDPVVASAAVINSLQTLASRAINPLDPIVCTVSTIHGGAVDNVVPDAIELTGTVRTLNDTTRPLAREHFFRLVESAAATQGCTAEIDWRPGYPVTNNHPQAADAFFTVARRAFGPRHVVEVPQPFMGGEDFSYYGLHAPACFFILGLLPVGDDPATTPRLHQPTFDFNDEAIAQGVRAMVELALHKLPCEES